MGIRLGAHGREETPARAISSALLTTLMLATVAGCGARKTDQASSGARSGNESSTPTTVAGNESSKPTTVASNVSETATHEMATSAIPTHLPGYRPAGPVHQIRLSQKGCVQFEPQWTNVRLGQAVTWHSDLKTPVRIYVSPGVFARASYLVRPGTTVNTGPALAPGRYAFWAEPKACRQAPRGVLLAGPGVRVQENLYASTGPR
jgi:hypothetical protein